jgi:hypothetical protein
MSLQLGGHHAEDERPFIADHAPMGATGRTVGLGGLELAHEGTLALLAGLTMAAVGTWWGTPVWAPAAAVGVGTWLLLRLAHWLRLAISELYRQLQYREKFGLFLAHVAVVVAAGGLAGVRDPGMLLIILAAVLSLQAINGLWVARLIFALVAAFFVSLARVPAPPVGLGVAWMAALLLAIRLGHVRFRIEQLGAECRIPWGDFLRRTATVVALPVLAGWGAWRVAGWAGLSRRMPVRRAPDQPVDWMGALREAIAALPTWQQILVLVALAGLIGVVIWMHQLLQRRRPNTPPAESLGEGSVRPWQAPTTEETPPVEETPTGARARVLAAFRQFATALGRGGQGRPAGETAAGYLARHAPAADTTVFDRACYASMELSDEEAAAFERSLREAAENRPAPPAGGAGS